MYQYRLGPLAAQKLHVQWTVLIILSVLFVLLLQILHLPAALLLGPMAAAILVTAAQGALRVPHWPFIAAQSIVGCMIARVITPSTLGAMGHDWPLFLATTSGVVAAGAWLGWLLARRRVLPGTTAVWGSFPGAATAMVLMAEAYGADIRLVAFMQYLRVVFVALAATVVAGIWTTASGGQTANVLWFPPIHWLSFIETLALAGFGVVVSYRLRISAGPLLLPLVIGAALQAANVMTIELPPWLLAICYMLIGWSIGLRFTRPILAHAARALPRVVASILVLIAIGGVLATLLVTLAGIEPLTAYLATSPGGADSVAIIAASAKVDVPFVMAMQIGRFLIVLFVGPPLARLVASWTGVAEESE
ncbi:MAG: AbrB family transcriptional regulator [Beijerinckiaceae bacterium]